MTKAAAIHQWFSSLGLTTYVSTSVPDNAPLPYLTYEYKTGAFGDYAQNIAVNVYWRTEKETTPNAWVEQFSETVSLGGVVIQCDSGKIWIKRGYPFAQPVRDTDSGIKRRYINLTLDFFTTE